MQAAVFHRYGPPEVLHIENVPKPIPKDNEVLIRVHAATVCAADWRMRTANPVLLRLMNGFLRPKKVTIPGMEFSGTVQSVGKAVTHFRPGDEVFGGTGFNFGACAEYVCLPEYGTLALKPVNMSFEQAAAVLFGGFTALTFLRKAKIQAGQNVLVYGASGSCGVFIVQLAKHFGARVTGVCSTGNLETVKSLGADEIIDYTKEDFSRAVPVYDAIYDTVGHSGSSRSLKALERGGVYARVGGSGRLAAMFGQLLHGLWLSITGKAKVVGGVAGGNAADMAFLKKLIEEGKLTTVIDRCYPLSQIVEAHRHTEGGHKKGHVVILIPQP